MKSIKNWWFSWDGPAYKLHKLTTWVSVQLANRGWLTGNCVGCGMTTKEFDSYFKWHICPLCYSNDVAYSYAEYIPSPSSNY